MTVTTKVRKQGGSVVVSIPPAMLKFLNISIGDSLALDMTDAGFIAHPVRQKRKRYTLAELLEGSEHMAEINAETAWAREGDPVGNEIA